MPEKPRTKYIQPLSFTISLDNIGKRYNREWIFRGISRSFEEGSTVILGPNGSGKSTLLQLMAGAVSPSEGLIKFSSNGNDIPVENVFRYVSIASPYLELIEEYTFEEAAEFQAGFKDFFPELKTSDIIELSGLQKAKNKLIKYYSSGMKQRAKLTLAILSNTPLLFLDEPVSNLDKAAISWYSDLISKYTAGRICIVCSNQQTEEYFFCKEQLNISDYK